MRRLSIVLASLVLAASCTRAPTGLTCPSAMSDTAADLLVTARLTVSETGRTTPYPWVLEATQSIATIRDDAPNTAWLLPAGPSWLQVDWQPSFQGPTALASLEFRFGGSAPQVTVELEEWCGGPMVRKIDASASQSIDLGGTCAGCVRLRFESDGTTTLSEAHLLTRDVRAAPRAVPTPPPETSARYPLSGVVEGFYGVPWSWRERHNMVATLAANGMGLYIYAPKNDPLHRDDWRTPYPPEQLQKFVELHRFASLRQVAFFLGISPFVDFDAGSAADYQALKVKLQPFVEAGFSDFAVLADDIEQNASLRIDGALGAAHVAAVNRLLADLRSINPAVKLIFVPTVYNQTRIQSLGAGDEYLAEMQQLDTSIGFMWTGNDTGNLTISGDDLEHVTQVTGRSPIIWDNFYANDGGDGFQGRLFLAPYSGRSADLPSKAAGIVNNMSIQGGLSRLELSTVGDYLDHPEDPDPARARLRAARVEASFQLGPTTVLDPQPALGRIMASFDGFSSRPSTHAELSDRLSAVTAASSSDAATLLPLVKPTLELLGELAVLQDQVRRSPLETDLADELSFPLEKVRLESEAGLHTLQWLSAKANGADDPESHSAADEALGASALKRITFGRGEVQALYDAVKARPGDGGTPENPIPATPACRVGAAASWTASNGNLRLFGPTEPSQGPANSVSWVPGQPGEVFAVIEAVRTTPPSWFWRSAALQCAP